MIALGKLAYCGMILDHPSYFDNLETGDNSSFKYILVVSSLFVNVLVWVEDGERQLPCWMAQTHTPKLVSACLKLGIAMLLTLSSFSINTVTKGFGVKPEAMRREFRMQSGDTAEQLTDTMLRVYGIPLQHIWAYIIGNSTVNCPSLSVVYKPVAPLFVVTNYYCITRNLMTTLLEGFVIISILFVEQVDKNLRLVVTVRGVFFTMTYFHESVAS